MNRFKRIICLLLLAIVVAQVTVLPVTAFNFRDTVPFSQQSSWISGEVNKVMSQLTEETVPEETQEA